MAEEQPKKDGAAPEKKGGGGGIGVVMMLVSGLLSAGAAFGGTQLALATASGESAPAEGEGANMPGPTVDLEPFVITILDDDGKAHAMRVKLAVELEVESLQEEFDPFVPRIRDATLTYLRAIPHAKASDDELHATMREELLAKYKELGAEKASQILITEFVVQ